jgi:membrane-associated phospholipid phosphatase
MFVNIWKKISLHAIGIGGFAAFCGWQQVTDANWSHYWLIAAVLVAGLVGTSRLIRKAHIPSDIYAGYLAGLVCQVAAGIVYS